MPRGRRKSAPANHHQDSVDAAVHRAVAAWQKAHVSPRHFTGRKDSVNRRLQKRYLKVIDTILDDATLLPAERKALRRTASPFRRTVASIFYAPEAIADGRPAVREEGYAILADCVR